MKCPNQRRPDRTNKVTKADSDSTAETSKEAAFFFLHYNCDDWRVILCKFAVVRDSIWTVSVERYQMRSVHMAVLVRMESARMDSHRMDSHRMVSMGHKAVSVLLAAVKDSHQAIMASGQDSTELASTTVDIPMLALAAREPIQAAIRVVTISIQATDVCDFVQSIRV